MRTSKRFAATTGMTGLAVAGGTLLLAQTVPSTSPSTLPAAAATVPSTHPTTAQITLHFKDVPVDTVLEHISQVAGLTIIKSQPVEGRVTLFTVPPVSIDEAISSLNTALRVLNGGSGYTAIRQGKVLRVIPLADAVNETNVIVANDPDDPQLTETDDLVTVEIHIRNIDAVKLRQSLAPLININAHVAADAGSNTIIVTDRMVSIKRLVRIIAALDKDVAKSATVKTFKLKNASASAAAKLIQTLFPQTTAANGGGNGNNRGGGGGGNGGPGGGFPGFGGGPGGGGGGGRGGGGGGGGADATAALTQGKVLVAADDRTNILVLTGSPDTIELIKTKVIDPLDLDEAKLALKVFSLKNADATTAAKMITSIFSPTGSGSSGGGGANGQNGGGRRTTNNQPSSGTPGEFDSALQSGQVTAVADDRTNGVVITAPTAALPLIAQLLNDLDANPIPVQSVFIYPLRNAQAANLEYVLNNLFGGGSSGTSGNRTGSTSSTANRSGSSSTSAFGGGSSGGSGFGSSSTSRGGSSSGGFGSSGSSGSSFGSTSSINRGSTTSGGSNSSSLSRNSSTSALGDLAGQVFVVSDPDTNSLLVTCATRFEPPVKQIIAELDRSVPQVLIKVLVAEVTHDDGVDLGLDFSFANKRPSGEGTSISNAFGNSAQTTGLVVSVLEDKINAQLHVAATAGKLDVLSRPYILASDNQPASILVGNSVPLVTGTSITESGQQINQITYRDVGIILNVTPHINPDGLVIMDVNPEVSQLSAQTVAISSTTSAPVITTRSADSRVGVRSGQTIVIGGLMQDTKTSTISKLPILGDIPILGWAFSRVQVSRSKTELLFFITPQVAQQPDLLQGATDAERQQLKIAPRAVGPGEFNKHIDDMGKGAMPMTRPSNPNDVAKPIPIPPKKPVIEEPQQNGIPNDQGNRPENPQGNDNGGQ